MIFEAFERIKRTEIVYKHCLNSGHKRPWPRRHDTALIHDFKNH